MTDVMHSDAHLAPTVLIFTPVILPTSQTFIKNHAESLNRFRPYIVGLREVNELKLQNIPVHILPKSKLRRFMLYILGANRDLENLVRENDVRLIHCHFADTAPLMINFGRRMKIPVVVTIHGSDVLRTRKRNFDAPLQYYLQRVMRSHAHLFLPVSKWLLEEVLQRGFPKDRTRVHYLGIPIPKQHTSHTQKSEWPVILYAGRLVEKKGILFLLEAASLLERRGLKFEVRVLGGGPLDEIAKQFARERELRVKFLGSTPFSVVQHEMRQADVFCMPSTQAADGDNEGLGLVYLEAQSLGLPVIAFKQGPVPEAVQEGSTALLCKDRSSRDLAEALSQILQNMELRARMSDAGPEFVSRFFDITNRNLVLESIYENILKER